MLTVDLTPEPTTTPATTPTAPDFSVDWPKVATEISPMAIAAIEQYAMTIADGTEVGMKLAKAIVQGKIEAARVAQVWFAGLPASYPQVVGVVDCCRYEERFKLAEMSSSSERHGLLAVKAAEHIAALPADSNDMAYYLTLIWDNIALKLVN